MGYRIPLPPGAASKGVHTLDDLRARCEVEEGVDDPCWIWRGCVDPNDQAPRVWLPALQRAVTASAAIAHLTTGKPAPKGKVYHPMCCTGAACVRPEHRKLGARTHGPGKNMDAGIRARLVIGGRNAAPAAKLTPEQREEIRAGTRSDRELAAAFGVSRAAVANVRRGQSFRQLLPGASVFSWRPGA